MLAMMQSLPDLAVIAAVAIIAAGLSFAFGLTELVPLIVGGGILSIAALALL